MVEIKGITLPVVSIRIDPSQDLESIKENLKKKIKGNLFKGSFFIIENADSLKKEVVEEIERFLTSLNLGNIKKMGKGEAREDSYRSERLLIVDRSLRSGQRVEHGGDVLILGDVNKDAEVVAVGNIVVMGALRGIAIAGALGDENAVVVALKMEPQQIRIGRKIAILDDSDRTSPGYPEVAKVEEGQIVLDRI